MDWITDTPWLSRMAWLHGVGGRNRVCFFWGGEVAGISLQPLIGLRNADCNTGIRIVLKNSQEWSLEINGLKIGTEMGHGVGA